VYTVFAPSSPSHALSPLLPLVPLPSPQDLFHLLVLRFCKRKKMTICLFKIAIQGVSLLYFHVYMYYNQIDSSPLFFFFLL
jgi:hypothetical protein